MKLKKNILILTEASHSAGLGHLKRCMFLSDELKNFFNVYFFLKNKSLLNDRYNHFSIKNLNNKINFSSLIIDLKNVNNKYLNLIKKIDIKNRIIISDKVIKNVKARLTIIPYIVKKNSQHKNIISGVNALIFNDNLKKLSLKKVKISKNKSVLICMGGSDPKNLTLKIVNNLMKLNLSKIKFKIILGPLFNRDNKIKLKKLIYSKKNFYIIDDPQNFYQIIQKSDFGIINSGNIKYELASLGVPFFLFANDKKSKLFCKYFSKQFKFFSSKDFKFPKKESLNKILNSVLKSSKLLDDYRIYNKTKINLNSTSKLAERIDRLTY
jgi:UDP-2,4-diacetamido-2,4,6-trideoxy-beta-L-altropyranose hydrolase